MGSPTVLGALMMAAACIGMAGGCSYAPHFKDGELRCSLSGECPAGYTCQNDACFAKTGDGGQAMDTPSAAAPSRYIGSWTLDPTASVNNHCDNGTVEIGLPLSPVDKPSVMNITAGVMGRSDLVSAWLCTLDLRVDAAGAHLSDTTPTCSQAATDPTFPNETWTATQFDIVLNGLRTATHTAKYTRVDQYANGTVVTCSQAVTASLTKN